jgi:hypothetical protein
MIPCSTIESSSFEFDTTEYITTTNHDDHFESFMLDEMDNLLGEEGEKLGVDPFA